MRITRRDQIGLKERRKAANARGCRAKGNKRGGKKLRKGKSKKWARAKSLLTGKAARRGRKPVETDADGDVAESEKPDMEPETPEKASGKPKPKASAKDL